MPDFDLGTDYFLFYKRLNSLVAVFGFNLAEQYMSRDALLYLDRR